MKILCTIDETNESIENKETSMINAQEGSEISSNNTDSISDSKGKKCNIEG